MYLKKKKKFLILIKKKNPATLGRLWEQLTSLHLCLPGGAHSRMVSYVAHDPLPGDDQLGLTLSRVGNICE